MIDLEKVHHRNRDGTRKFAFFCVWWWLDDIWVRAGRGWGGGGGGAAFVVSPLHRNGFR